MNVLIAAVCLAAVVILLLLLTRRGRKRQRTWQHVPGMRYHARHYGGNGPVTHHSRSRRAARKASRVHYQGQGSGRRA